MLKRYSNVLATLSLLLVFFLGFALGKSSKVNAKLNYFYDSSQPEKVDFSPVWKVWHVIDEKFVPTKPATSTATFGTEDSQEKRIWGMAQGLAASLQDPYTVFLPPRENKLFNEDIQGAFEGVGMEIAIRDGVLTVVSPLKDTPAFKAGIKAGDKIIKINGQDTKGMDIQSAVDKIRGKKGTKVIFEILRENEPKLLKIEVIRDTINIPTIETSKKGKDVFVIELMSFTAESPKLFAEALKEFINSKRKYLIIDLRGNPGGYLDASVDIASWFLPKGAVVVTEDFGEKRSQIIHRSRGNDIFKDKKIVVLIDKGSASAAEILAGALRAHKVAKLIGTNSFGKGSVQELVPITNGTSLKVTVARWILPDGSWIMGDGLKPDIEVKFPDKKELICNPEKRKEFESKDIIMDRALEYFKKI